METEDQTINRAIAKLPARRFFKKDGVEYEVSSLVPIHEWRPLREIWWKKKEACVIGQDSYGNLYLRVCDGTVRFWNHETQADEVLAPSVRKFVSSLSPASAEED